MKNITAIILAAGKGTRMRSDIPKVLHKLLGKPMISHILDSVREAGISDIITVAGFGGSQLKDALKGVKVVVQKSLLGSGDAVNIAAKSIGRYSGDILVLYGDTPLISAQTIEDVVYRHKNSRASLTLLTVKLDDPTGYGRIVRDPDGKIVKVVEDSEASVYEKAIGEINVGVYCFKAGDLFEALGELKCENKKKEYYLTDAIHILRDKGKRIESVISSDREEMIGVNTREELAEAARILKTRIMRDMMENSVTIEDPSTTTIYPDVRIGRETIIHPNTVIESDVEIGRSCRIGPFTRIRPGVRIGDNVEVGNFVELVRTTVGDDTKIKHLTYLGDAAVGKRVNIGAGTITANFDGKKKNKTTIDDGVSIGAGAVLIAPVRIGKRAVVGAGCVVPKNHDVAVGATVVGIPAKVLKKR